MNLKSLFKTTILLSISGFLLFSCKKRDPEERPIFPSAEFFAPWYVLPEKDTVEIAGSGLDGATVYLNGTQVSILSIDEKNELLKFIVPKDYTSGLVRVEFKDGETMTFIDSLTAVDALDERRTDIEGVLLIGDFDGGGIRPAYAGIDFTTGQWAMEAPVGATNGIGQNQFNTSSSPEGGNYVYNDVPQGAIGGKATDGWAGAITSRNELMNDNYTSFPRSFAAYPNSPIEFGENDDPSEFYVNFYYKADPVSAPNRNGEDPTMIRVFLIDPTRQIDQWWAYNISNGENQSYIEEDGYGTMPMEADGKWHPVSIKWGDFSTGFGFNTRFNASDLEKINALQFTFSDSRVDADGNLGTVNGITVEEEWAKGVGPIRAYIDHVSISKGKGIY